MEKSLFKIQEEYLAIVNELEDNGGELTPELEEALKINETELVAKTNSYVYIMKMFDTNIELAKAEIERLKAFIEVREKQKESLQKNLLQAVFTYGKDDKLSPADKEKGKIPVRRLEVGTLRLSTRRSTITDIINENLVDDKYKYKKIQIKKLSRSKLNKILEILRDDLNISDNINVEEEISKTLIKEDLDKGIFVDGAKLTDNYGLTIK